MFLFWFGVAKSCCHQFVLQCFVAPVFSCQEKALMICTLQRTSSLRWQKALGIENLCCLWGRSLSRALIMPAHKDHSLLFCLHILKIIGYFYVNCVAEIDRTWVAKRYFAKGNLFICARHVWWGQCVSLWPHWEGSEVQKDKTFAMFLMQLRRHWVLARIWSLAYRANICPDLLCWLPGVSPWGRMLRLLPWLQCPKQSTWTQCLWLQALKLC